MFDIGFSELLLIGIVTLIVVGPERLPKVARTLGHLFGRVQRYVAEVKTDINRELKLEELRKLEADMREQARNMEHTMTDEINRTSQEFKQVAEAAQVTAPPAQPAAEPVPAVAEPAPAATEHVQTPASPQLELGLDAAPAKPEKTA
jgi:sec-independent protein translocase protein TatB